MTTHTKADNPRGRAWRGALLALLAGPLLLAPWPVWGSGAARFTIRLELKSVAEVNVVSSAGGVPMVMIGHTGTDVPPQVYVSGNNGGAPGPALQPTSQGGGTGWSVPLPRSARDNAGMVMTLVYL